MGMTLATTLRRLRYQTARSFLKMVQTARPKVAFISLLLVVEWNPRR